RASPRRRFRASLIRGASPLGLPHTLSRSPLRRLAPFAWLARECSLASYRHEPHRGPRRRVVSGGLAAQDATDGRWGHRARSRTKPDMLRAARQGTGVGPGTSGGIMSTTSSRREFLSRLGASGALLATGPWLRSIGYAQIARGPARAVILQSRTRADFDRRVL